MLGVGERKQYFQPSLFPSYGQHSRNQIR